MVANGELVSRIGTVVANPDQRLFGFSGDAEEGVHEVTEKDYFVDVMIVLCQDTLEKSNLFVNIGNNE